MKKTKKRSTEGNPLYIALSFKPLMAFLYMGNIFIYNGCCLYTILNVQYINVARVPVTPTTCFWSVKIGGTSCHHLGSTYSPQRPAYQKMDKEVERRWSWMKLIKHIHLAWSYHGFLLKKNWVTLRNSSELDCRIICAHSCWSSKFCHGVIHPKQPESLTAH